jgi:hypothetical protein
LKKLFIIIWILTSSLFSKAQQNIVRELAEPFTIELTFNANANVTAKENPSVSIEVLEIIQISGNQQTNTKKLGIQIIAYDTGVFRLSDIINGVDPANDLKFSISSPPENLIKEYAPVKEINLTFKEPTDLNNYLWVLPVVAAITFVLFWLLRKRKTKPETISIIPDENWRDNLFRITDGWKQGTLNSIELGEGLIGILHNRFNVPQKKSVRKLLKSIQNQLPGMNGYVLKDILVHTDAWRFGKQQADKATGDKAIETIKTIVETKEKTERNK